MDDKTQVFLEKSEGGLCMAHMPDYPGLIVRAGSEADVMARLPGEVGRYRAWLQRHGEFSHELGELEVAEVVEGAGPFEPSDKAALFSWERKPLGRAELERYLRLAAFSRADLMALVKPLGKRVRKWKPVGGGMSVNEVLRHIGSAEEWYVSRLAPPETLPPEWENDAEMPLFKFLKMERKTAVARIREMSDEELNRVEQPGHRTDHPEEEWNGRKMLRRMLQHEWEHTDHIRQIMARWRQELLARLAAERAHLLWQLRGIDEETLSSAQVEGEWTAKDLLAHVGAWDAFHSRRLQAVVEDDLAQLRPFNRQVMEEMNAAWQADFKQIPLEQAVAITMKERSGFLRVLYGLPDGKLHQKLALPWGETARVRKWVQWRYQHDETHSASVAKWREGLAPEVKQVGGPPFLMRALLQATQKEFTELAKLVPAAERESRPVCGVWCLKDLVGHLADWEEVGLAGLRQLSQKRAPEFAEPIMDFDAFNAEHAEARKDQPWVEVWADYRRARQATLKLMAYLTPEDMSRTFMAPWGMEISGYFWLGIWAMHEREHATDVRRELEMDYLPRRLRHWH